MIATKTEFNAPAAPIAGLKGFVNIAIDDRRLCNHTSQAEAEQEAIRLAKATGKHIVVFRPVVVIHPPEQVSPPPMKADDVSMVARFAVAG